MAIDIDSMAPGAREKYLAIGKRYATQDVLAQADKTLLGLTKYGLLLIVFGFGTNDAQRLAERRDALLEHFTNHLQDSGNRKNNRKSYLTLLRKAKDARLSVRTILDLTGDDLLESGNDQAAKPIQTVLDDTSAEAEDAALLDQLKALYSVLATPVLEPIIATRGGVEILGRLTAAQTDLRSVLPGRADDPEGPAASEIRDILDGMVVTSVRAARAAARVAARAHGQPAIARAFKLDCLRPSRYTTAPDDEAPELPETDPPTAA
jgi:hypothetical protein